MSVDVDAWAEVVGQGEALDLLRRSAADPVHAYMFLGPRGSGRWAAAKAFAAIVLSSDLEGHSAERAVDLALRGQHPDLLRIEPTGTEYRKEEVDFLITEASRTPVEGSRKVIVADRFHTANATAIGRLLKTLEEPPASTIIVLLTEELPDEQVTIASRCLVVPFQAVPESDLVSWLEARGLSGDIVETVALASGGDLQRAQDLAADPQVVERFEAWRSVPDRLDGTGAAVAIAVEELRSLIDASQESIDARHTAELEALAEREEQLGTRGSGRTDLVAAQKREVRRMRTDELHFGLAALARVIRERMGDSPSAESLARLDALRDANEALTRNPNEALLLQALFLKLGPQ